MNQQNQDNPRLFKWLLRLILVIFIMVAVGLIAAGMSRPKSEDPWQILLRTGLIQIGTSLFIASTLGVVLTETHKILRKMTIKNEMQWLVDQVKLLIRDPTKFWLYVFHREMEIAGLLAFYHTRIGDAVEDLRSTLLDLLNVKKRTVVYLFGDTLRVFFNNQNLFTEQMRQVLCGNSNVFFRVLILHPNSKLALYRSEAESLNAPFTDDNAYKRSYFYRESEITSCSIEDWNKQFRIMDGQEGPRIEVKYYDCADFCLAVMFPDDCFTAQYAYADNGAQATTPEFPMLKYSKDSKTYERLQWNFNWVWKSCSVTYEEVQKSLVDKPVVRLRSEGKL